MLPYPDVNDDNSLPANMHATCMRNKQPERLYIDVRSRMNNSHAERSQISCHSMTEGLCSVRTINVLNSERLSWGHPLPRDTWRAL